MLARVRSNLSIADALWAAVAGTRAPAETLECAFARRFDFPHALLFPYARTALHALLLARDWRDKDVLCPAYICAEVPHAITAAGSRVRFVDSAADHFLPGRAEWASASGADAALAVITPLFGYPVDKEAEADLRRSASGVFILYDESQSFGVEDDGGLQMRDADGVLLSFGLGKMVTALSGGLLLLRDTALFHAVRALRDTRYRRPTLAHTAKRLATGLAAWAAFREPALSILDYAARRYALLPARAEDWIPNGSLQQPADAEIMPSPFQARLGLRQLGRLDQFLAARRQVARHYQDRLRQEGLRTFACGHCPTWPRYPLPVARRDAVIAELHRQNIQISVFLPYSCADLPLYRGQAEACPNAALWGRSMINLPDWYGMNLQQAEHVVGALARLKERDREAVAWPAAVGSAVGVAG
jgi:dTDP-4-amino-4,6-dideoxygalactose transaminase